MTPPPFEHACYIGKCRLCEAIRVAVVDDRDHQPDVANAVRRIVADKRLKLERLESCEPVRRGDWTCKGVEGCPETERNKTRALREREARERAGQGVLL